MNGLGFISIQLILNALNIDLKMKSTPCDVIL